MIDQLIDTHKGVEIRVNGNGKFEAVIGEKKCSRASLGSIRNLIDEQADPVHLLYMSDQYLRINPIGLNGRKRRDGRVQSVPSLKIFGSWDHVYYFDQAAFDQLQEIYGQIMELVEKSHKIEDTLKRF